MTDNQKLLLLIAGGIALAAALAGGGYVATEWWLQSAQAKKWGPALAAAEQQYGIPTGLLSRQAQEESGFQPSVIDGTQASSAGALGILQMMPQYFSSVNVPTPFSDADVLAQINQAAQYDAQLYSQFGNWADALDAYNWGPGAVSNWIANGSDPAQLPTQTSNYSSQILADVPAAALA